MNRFNHIVVIKQRFTHSHKYNPVYFSAHQNNLLNYFRWGKIPNKTVFTRGTKNASDRASNHGAYTNGCACLSFNADGFYTVTVRQFKCILLGVGTAKDFLNPYRALLFSIWAWIKIMIEFICLFFSNCFCYFRICESIRIAINIFELKMKLGSHDNLPPINRNSYLLSQKKSVFFWRVFSKNIDWI